MSVSSSPTQPHIPGTTTTRAPTTHAPPPPRKESNTVYWNTVKGTYNNTYMGQTALGIYDLTGFRREAFPKEQNAENAEGSIEPAYRVKVVNTDDTYSRYRFMGHGQYISLTYHEDEDRQYISYEGAAPGSETFILNLNQSPFGIPAELEQPDDMILGEDAAYNVLAPRTDIDGNFKILRFPYANNDVSIVDTGIPLRDGPNLQETHNLKDLFVDANNIVAIVGAAFRPDGHFHALFTDTYLSDITSFEFDYTVPDRNHAGIELAGMLGDGSFIFSVTYVKENVNGQYDYFVKIYRLLRDGSVISSEYIPVRFINPGQRITLSADGVYFRDFYDYNTFEEDTNSSIYCLDSNMNIVSQKDTSSYTQVVLTIGAKDGCIYLFEDGYILFMKDGVEVERPEILSQCLENYGGVDKSSIISGLVNHLEEIVVSKYSPPL